MDDFLFSYAVPTDPPVKRGLIRLMEKATGQPKLKRLYLDNQRFPRPSESFWAAAVRSLALDVLYDEAALARLPRTGPTVFVANHPYGVLDGLVISWLVQKVRPDFLVLYQRCADARAGSARLCPADRFFGDARSRRDEYKIAGGGEGAA